MRYVDGFVLPVPKKNLQAYRRLAQKAGRSDGSTARRIAKMMEPEGNAFRRQAHVLGFVCALPDQFGYLFRGS